jgi:hypothetical protein
MEMNEDNIQLRLFEQTLRIIPSSVSLVDELCSLLNLSDDSVRRRLKGETQLTLEEIVLICNKYGISFDSLIGIAKKTVAFDYEPMTNETNYINYLHSIRRDLEVVNSHSNGQSIYAGEDIPLFHNFGFPALARFKVFYWLKSIMNVPELQGIKYNPGLINDEILAAGRELYDMYAKTRSIEIWTEITPISLFKQIEFFHESGFFESTEQALAIYDDIRELFMLMEKSTEVGCKFDSNRNLMPGKDTFQLYCSEIEIGNNCILTDVDGDITAYLAFNTFNKLSTRDKPICNDIYSWLKNLIRKSTPISGVSEMKRSQFFKSLNHALDDSRRKITG